MLVIQAQRAIQELQVHQETAALVEEDLGEQHRNLAPAQDHQETLVELVEQETAVLQVIQEMQAEQEVLVVHLSQFLLYRD